MGETQRERSHWASPFVYLSGGAAGRDGHLNGYVISKNYFKK